MGWKYWLHRIDFCSSSCSMSAWISFRSNSMHCIAMGDNGSQSRSKSHSQSIRLGISVRSTNTSAALVSLWLKHRSIFKTITKFELHELIYSEINLRFNHKMPRIYGEFKEKKTIAWIPECTFCSVCIHFVACVREREPNNAKSLDIRLIRFTWPRISIEIVFLAMEKR